MKAESVVVDTNVLISARLVAGSTPAKVLDELRARGARLLFSPETLAELSSRLRKRRLRKYVSESEIVTFLEALGDVAELREPSVPVVACRDPDDDKFLALALDGEADCIVTGDGDLLDLDPFEAIPILTPSSFLEAITASRKAAR